MMKKIHPLAIVMLGLMLTLAGCSREGYEDAATEGEDAVDQATEAVGEVMAAAAGNVHAVRCGCSLEEVDKCGNYVEVEGEFIPLVTSAELEVDHMAFCGKSDLEARVEGEVRGGSFIATSFEYVEAEPGG